MFAGLSRQNLEEPHEIDYLEDAPEQKIRAENTEKDLFTVLEYASCVYVEERSGWAYEVGDEDSTIVCWKRKPDKAKHFEARVENEEDIMVHDYSRRGTIGPGILTKLRQRTIGTRPEDARADLDQLQNSEYAYLDPSTELEDYVEAIELEILKDV